MSMATTKQQRRMFFDAATEIISADSLSFSDLACIQDRSLKPEISLQPSKREPEFVFGHSTPNLIADSPDKLFSPADQLFSHGQILPKSIPPHLSPSQLLRLDQVSSKELLPPRTPSHPSGSSRSSSSRRSSDNELGFSKAARKPNNVSNQGNKNQTDGNHSFGQKIFKSFAAPCRGCSAIEPSRSRKLQTL